MASSPVEGKGILAFKPPNVLLSWSDEDFRWKNRKNSRIDGSQLVVTYWREIRICAVIHSVITKLFSHRTV